MGEASSERFEIFIFLVFLESIEFLFSVHATLK